MAADYTFDVFSSLDGYGSYDSGGDWGGYWGKQGPEFLDRRLTQYREDQRMVFGANTYRAFARMLAASSETDAAAHPHPTLSLPRKRAYWVCARTVGCCG